MYIGKYIGIFYIDNNVELSWSEKLIGKKEKFFKRFNFFLYFINIMNRFIYVYEIGSYVIVFNCLFFLK